MTNCRLALWMGVGAAGLPVALPNAAAQSTPTTHVTVPVIAARPEAVSSIEGIVKGDCESISGGVGVARQWARDLTLYDPNARSFSPYTDPKTHALVVWIHRSTDQSLAVGFP